MDGLELLELVYVWLPRIFVLDLLLFHLVADHPLAWRWWAGRSSGAPLEAAGVRR